MVVAVEDMPAITVDVQGLVEEVVELDVLAQLAQAYNPQQQMLEVMEDCQQFRVHHGLMELMVIR